VRKVHLIACGGTAMTLLWVKPSTKNVDHYLILLREKGLSKENKSLLNTWRNELTNNQTLKCNDAELDTERLKGLFELYFEKKAEKDRRQKIKYEEFFLEYALSQIFPPKQKNCSRKTWMASP